MTPTDKLWFDPRTCVARRGEVEVLLRPNEAKLLAVLIMHLTFWVRTVDICAELFPGTQALNWLTVLSAIKGHLNAALAPLGLFVESHQGHGYRLINRVTFPSVEVAT